MTTNRGTRDFDQVSRQGSFHFLGGDVHQAMLLVILKTVFQATADRRGSVDLQFISA